MHMTIKRRTIVLSFLLVGTYLFTACPSRVSISKINADPGRYQNKEVGITGRVGDSYGFMGTGAYELSDGTGSIWVVTKSGVPSRGSKIGAKGRVQTGFSFGGRSFGTILEETDRRVE